MNKARCQMVPRRIQTAARWPPPIITMVHRSTYRRIKPLCSSLDLKAATCGKPWRSVPSNTIFIWRMITALRALLNGTTLGYRIPEKTKHIDLISSISWSLTPHTLKAWDHWFTHCLTLAMEANLAGSESAKTSHTTRQTERSEPLRTKTHRLSVATRSSVRTRY